MDFGEQGVAIVARTREVGDLRCFPACNQGPQARRMSINIVIVPLTPDSVHAGARRNRIDVGYSIGTSRYAENTME